MKILYSSFIFALLSLLAACQSISIAEHSNLKAFIEQQIIPYLNTHLINKPRFRQRPIMLVKLVNGQISSEMDSITATIRDQIETHLLQQQGILLYRSNNDIDKIRFGSQSTNCLNRPELFLGIEISTHANNTELSLKMLDKEQNNWVDGFALIKKLNLNKHQINELNVIKADPWLRGFRESPYKSDERDLLVNDLARQINCQLMKQSHIKSLSFNLLNIPQSDFFHSIVALLKNDLPILTTLPLQKSKQPNQLALNLDWIVLNKEKGIGRLSLSNKQIDTKLIKPVVAQVYLKTEQAQVQAKKPSLALQTKALIKGITIEVPKDLSLCARSNPWHHGRTYYKNNALIASQACIRLNIKLFKPAYLFVLNYSTNKNWYRLFPSRCLDRTQLPELKILKTRRSIPDSLDSMQTLLMEGPKGVEEIIVFAIESASYAQKFELFLNNIPDVCSDQQMLDASFEKSLYSTFKKMAPKAEYQQFLFTRY